MMNDSTICTNDKAIHTNNKTIRYEISKDLKQFYSHDGKPICPLVIGVTGHRDIVESDVAVIKQSIADSLTSLCKKWNKLNKRNDIPILVLDGMAVGADQLVAEVVLELKQHPNTQCLKLVSVLPMPWDDYQKDFESNLELSKTEQLRQASDAEIVISLSDNNSQKRKENSSADIERKEQYILLGEFLVHASFLMFALWDGKGWKKRSDARPEAGGSADVVRMAMMGNTMSLDHIKDQNKQYIFDRNEWNTIQPYGYVFAINSSRKKESTEESIFVKTVQKGEEKITHNLPVGTTGLCHLNDILDPDINPNKDGKNKKIDIDLVADKLQEISFFAKSMKDCLKQEDIHNCLEDLAMCNSDMFIKLNDSDLQQSQEYLLKDFEPQPNGVLFTLVHYYKYFDTLSSYFQTKFKSISSHYIWACLILGIFFYIHCLFQPQGDDAYWVKTSISQPTEYGPVSAFVDIIYTVILIYLGIAYAFSGTRRYYERYHRYRAVAEALRVQIFWYMGNISENVTNYYHNNPISDITWLRMMLNAIQIPISIQNDMPQDHPDLDFIFTNWVKDQRNFFLNNIILQSEAGDRWDFWRTVFLYGFAFWLVIRLFNRSEFWILIDKTWDIFGVIIVSIVMIAFATSGIAAICCYTVNHLRCYDSQAQRYKKNCPIYTSFCNYIEDHLNSGIDDSLNQKALFAFGRYALSENADWFLTKRKLGLPS